MTPTEIRAAIAADPALQALAEVDQVLWRVVTDDDQQREVGRLVGKVWRIEG